MFSIGTEMPGIIESMLKRLLAGNRIKKRFPDPDSPSHRVLAKEEAKCELGTWIAASKLAMRMQI